MQISSSSGAQGGGDDNLIPLINVIFLMLIFFMIAGTILPSEVFEVMPPASRAKTPAALDQIQVLVAADGRVALDGDEMPVAELAGALQQMLASRNGVAAAPRNSVEAVPTAPITPAATSQTDAAPVPVAPPPAAPVKIALKADAGLPARELNAVLDALRSAGAASVTLFTVEASD